MDINNYLEVLECWKYVNEIAINLDLGIYYILKVEKDLISFSATS